MITIDSSLEYNNFHLQLNRKWLNIDISFRHTITISTHLLRYLICDKEILALFRLHLSQVSLKVNKNKKLGFLIQFNNLTLSVIYKS